uniref:Uncharacterized protein n=1 Tax=Moniliophthora roreri TaxID=221103 RepID=A0A0W0F1V0_MONRR
MTTPTTPRTKSSFPSTPTAQRTSSSHVVQSSPHYTTTRRHSLYGVEDRVVIDPGSRIWKVGFSGEGRPRDVFYSTKATPSLWRLQRAAEVAERAEEDRLLEVRMEQCLRSVFHDSLLTDPKARKVILVEHPLLPMYIKDTIARVLFDNLQVPSVSFACSHLLSLLAVGRITGLVLDCGYLESVVLPIFASRPLFPQLRTTPLAGSRLSSHLRSLLLLFGTYLPPTSPGPVNIPMASRSMRVPAEVLTDSVLEDTLTRCCFVGEALISASANDTREVTPGPDESTPSEIDLPPGSDATQSESDFSYAGRESTMSSAQMSTSDFSVISNPRAPIDPRGGSGSGGENSLNALANLYTRHSTATDLRLRIAPPSGAGHAGLGYATLIIPGWIRERAAEILFEEGDVDEKSIAEVILDALLKVCH